MTAPSSTLVTYLGADVLANRPATPNLVAGTVGLFWATDTKTLYAYDLTNNAWSVAGGVNPGTPPAIVQSISGNTGGGTGGGVGLTFGVAPTNGNLLVAMCFNPSTDTANSGWTKVGENSSGTDFGVILVKTAGAGESTTQTPLSGSASAGCMTIWELSGVTTGALFNGETGSVAALSNSSPPLPIPANCIFLGAIGLVSTSNNMNMLFNVTQDHKDTSGTTRQIAAGHATANTAALGSIAASFTGSGTPTSKALGVVIAT